MAILLIISGLLGGILGGMGMGGGTILIPLLTGICGVDQHVAQAINLIAFVPMSLVALAIHFRHGFVKARSIVPLILAACVSGAAASCVAQVLHAAALKHFFGAFLIVLGVALAVTELIRVVHKDKSIKPVTED